MRAPFHAVVLLLLAACHRQPAAPPEDPRGEALAAFRLLRSGGPRTLGMALPDDLPRYLPVPQDSFVTGSLPGERPGTGALEYSTTLKPAAALDFYRLAAARAGLKEVAAGGGERPSVRWTNAAGAIVLVLEIQPIGGAGSVVRVRYG